MCWDVTKELSVNTIGQRKGLGLALKESMYVVAVDPVKNQVILGRNEDLFSRELIANDVNLISVDHIEGEMRVKAKVRYRHEEQWATVTQPDRTRSVWYLMSRNVPLPVARRWFCMMAMWLSAGATIIETEIAKRYS